jgi:LDH2 family malate/lactate/ureidoglycolate dehydrogenase
MDTLIERVHGCPTAQGVDEVLVAGEPELRHEAERRRRGIPYGANEVATLQEEAARAGVAPLAVSRQPLAA